MIFVVGIASAIKGLFFSVDVSSLLPEAMYVTLSVKDKGLWH